MKKICVVTSTRAEYGLLRNLLQKIKNDSLLELCLIVTGTHLSHEFGMTVTEIECDKIIISDKIDILMSSDNASGISKTMGMASISFADAFERHKPDLLVVLGDRYELLPICASAVNALIPIAHISGGETTEGAIDEMVRHCITKMSYLHFPACETYRKRIIQLGEDPERVFNFGDVGVELVKNIKIIEKKELQDMIGFDLENPYACVTFHSLTLEKESAEVQIDELLKAILHFPNLNFIFTKGNADANGRIINNKIDKFVAVNKNCVAHTSLGVNKYLSCLKYAEIVIGNSSSGIVEAPSFGVPTVNIGDRQKGRLQAKSIINCDVKEADIVDSIRMALTQSFKEESKNAINPYGDGSTSEGILKTIKKFLYEDKINLKKRFFDIDFKY